MTKSEKNLFVLKNLLLMVAIVFTFVILVAKTNYAEEYGDEFGGPGIGLADSTWDGSQGNRIYGYGNLNGIVGNVVDEHNATSGGPQVYQVYNDNNPIDHSAIIGPQTASNDAYSLHFINDAGPGMGVQSNALGQAQYYNDGGPGMAFIQQQQAQYQLDNVGPSAVIYSVSPSDPVYAPNGTVYGQTATNNIN